MCDRCRLMLSEGLDLCVRARKLDAQDRTAALVDSDPKFWTEDAIERRAARHNALWPDTPISSRSGTVALWVQEQYDADVAAWENKARQHLSQGCPALLGND